jgi:hypothetical protein
MFETTNQTGKSNQNSAMALDHLANPPTSTVIKHGIDNPFSKWMFQ